MGNEVKKKSFVFNIEWQEVLKEYPPEVRLEVYDAIIEYVASGTLSELKPLSKMAFSFIKKEIDYNNDRYDEIISKRKEAGKKAMESRWGKSLSDDNKNNTCYQMLSDDNKNNTCQHKVTTVTDNDNVNVNVNVSSSSRTYAREEPTEEEKKEFFKYFFFQNYKNVRSEVDRFIAWNANKGIRPTMTEAQRWKPEDKSNRVSDKFLDTWKQLYTIAAHSGPQGEIAADSMLDENLSGKVMNGGYVLTCKKAVKDWIESNPEAAGQVLQPFLRGCPLTIRARRV